MKVSLPLSKQEKRLHFELLIDQEMAKEGKSRLQETLECTEHKESGVRERQDILTKNGKTLLTGWKEGNIIDLKKYTIHEK